MLGKRRYVSPAPRIGRRRINRWRTTDLQYIRPFKRRNLRRDARDRRPALRTHTARIAGQAVVAFRAVAAPQPPAAKPRTKPRTHGGHRQDHPHRQDDGVFPLPERDMTPAKPVGAVQSARYRDDRPIANRTRCGLALGRLKLRGPIAYRRNSGNHLILLVGQLPAEQIDSPVVAQVHRRVARRPKPCDQDQDAARPAGPSHSSKKSSRSAHVGIVLGHAATAVATRCSDFWCPQERCVNFRNLRKFPQSLQAARGPNGGPHILNRSCNSFDLRDLRNLRPKTGVRRPDWHASCP